MRLIPIWVLFISFTLLQTHAQERVKVALITFLQHLSNSNNQIDPSFGWNLTSEPCSGGWRGITCDPRMASVQEIVLDDLNLTGIFDAKSICSVLSLHALSIQSNSIQGELAAEIGNCTHLTQLLISKNRFSGSLPDSLSQLNNLKQLDISYNDFSGGLPELSKILGLTVFLAQYNHLNGLLAEFDFANFEQFNVSYNNFSGPIPANGGQFEQTSFMGNPELCGDPLPRSCQPLLGKSPYKIIMISGYTILASVFVIFVMYRIISRKKAKNTRVEGEKETKASDHQTKGGGASGTHKTSISQSEYSIGSSTDSPMISSSSSLVVLSNSRMKAMRFEDLLKAPAELLGRGKHGSLYKVIFENGSAFAVKRIKDWAISTEEFRRRMAKIDQARHPYVLPAVAFYGSEQEKLLVYEYQQNGSLFNFLHGNQSGGTTFDWSSRLCVAASLAEGLAFMHKELHEHGIAHGNLKSSNIMLKNDMQPCISEYGLMLVDNQMATPLGPGNVAHKALDHTVSPFKLDVYSFGALLLELLTGKMVHNTGFDLAKWVNSVVREEWTVEVFDKTLIAEAACEVRMVSMLQVAVKCMNTSPENRPTMQQVFTIINKIKEEEDGSMVSEA